MYRVAVITLIVMLAGLQYRLWVGKGSLAQVHHLQSVHARIAQSNARAKSRNAAMQAQIKDLKSGLGATEDRARDQMEMIKPGETFFLTVPDNAKPRGAATAPAPAG